MSEQADVITAAVLAVPGVAAMHSGMFGEVATYLPGRRVTGVRIGDAVDIHVSLIFDVPVRDTAAAIRRAVAALIALPVNVTIEDVVPPSTTGDRSAPPNRHDRNTASRRAVGGDRRAAARVLRPDRGGDPAAFIAALTAIDDAYGPAQREDVSVFVRHRRFRRFISTTRRVMRRLPGTHHHYARL